MIQVFLLSGHSTSVLSRDASMIVPTVENGNYRSCDPGCHSTGRMFTTGRKTTDIWSCDTGLIRLDYNLISARRDKIVSHNVVVSSFSFSATI